MLNDSELSILDSNFSKPSLNESLDIATRKNPDVVANTLNMPISHDVYEANKPELDRQKKLFDINPENLKKTHPKTANWLTDVRNSSVSIDDLDILKGMEDSVKEPERGFWNNAARGGLKTINALTGNLIEFVGNVTDDFDDYIVKTTGAPNPGIMFGDDGISWSWDIPPEKTGIEKIGKAISTGNIYDYQPRFTWENLKGDITPTNLAGYVAEQGIQSLPHMLATIYTLPAYIASRTEDIAENRVANDDRDNVTGSDLASSIVPATVVALMERLGSKATFGLGETIGAKGVAKAVGAAAAVEGGTEFIQEGIEYLGETLGTKKKLSAAEMFDRQLAGLVAGAGMGGTIRGASSTIEAISNKTERQIKSTVQSLSEQQQLDQIVTYAQTSTTNKRSASHFEDFVNTLGEDRQVLIPNDIAEQMTDAPEYVTDKLNDLGISIAIPLKKFASEIAKNEEWMTLIRPHIKLSENMMTQAELDEGNRGEIKALLDRAKNDKELITESEKIFETVKDQLKATGYQGESTARYSAQLYPAAAAVYVEKARKAGHDVSIIEVFEMMGFEVKAGDVEVDVQPGLILDQPAYKDAPDIFDKARNKFLDTLPEDAESIDVMGAINEFRPEYRNLINALERDDWLGFDYPSQAINAVLSEDLSSYDVSIGVKQAIGRLINSEIEGNQPFLQSDIPNDLEITMDSEVIETGEIVSETFNAKELSAELDDKLELYQRLRDCLA